MSDVEPVFRRVARILLTSSVVAGAAAGIAGAVGGAGKRPDRASQVRQKGLDTFDSAKSRVANAMPEDAASQFTSTLQEAADRAASQRKKLHMNGSRTRKARRKGEALRSAAREEGQRLTDVASGFASEAIDRIGNSGIDGQDVRKRAQHAFDQQRSSFDTRRQQVQEESAERISDLKKELAGTVEHRVKPTIARAGENAEHFAGDLSTRLRGELKNLTAMADQRRPQLAAAAEHASERINQILKDADASSDEWRESAEHALRNAEKVIQENAAEARTVAGNVGGTAKEEGRNLVSLLFWLTVAGGLIYTVLLNDDQKRKAKEISSTVWHEGRELYRHIQGRDAEFE